LTSSNSDNGCGGGCVGGIIGGCFVPVLMLILWLSGSFAKWGCASPFAAKAKEPTFSGSASTTTTANADVELPEVPKA
jgi:hypothetical protein